MKKAILTLMLAIVAIAAFAQSDTTKKAAVKVPAVFNPDMTVQRPVSLTLSIDEVSLLVTSPGDWEKLDWSAQHTGEQIQQLKAKAGEVRKKLSDHFTAIVAQEKKAFDADTLKAVAVKNRKGSKK